MVFRIPTLTTRLHSQTQFSQDRANYHHMEYQYQSVQRQLQDAQRSLATKEHELNSERAQVRACSPAMLYMGMQTPAVMHCCCGHAALQCCAHGGAAMLAHSAMHACMHGNVCALSSSGGRTGGRMQPCMVERGQGHINCVTPVIF